MALHEIPPNGQGITALIALGILRQFDLAAHAVDSADSLHLQIEATKLAFADAHRYVCDPGTREGHAQMMVRLFDYGQNPQTVLDAPRWRFDTGLQVALEASVGVEVCAELERRGHELHEQGPAQFGGGQLIYRLDDGGYIAASELRKDGQPVSF